MLDIESTIWNKGSPFDPRNKMCLVGLKDLVGADIYDIEYTPDQPYGHKLEEIKTRIERTELLIGFNLKFDMNWIKKYIPDIKWPPIWDVQLGQYLINRQTQLYPSLDGVAKQWGFIGKDDLVRQYWNRRTDTPDIPKNILWPYLEGDLTETEKVFHCQWDILCDNNLFKLHCRDLLVLQEMEFEGIKFDYAEAKKRADETMQVCLKIIGQLESMTGNNNINWGSPKQVSTVLYGGYLEVPCKVIKRRAYKDGSIREREVNGVRQVSLPGVFPREKGLLDNTQASVAEDVLRKIKAKGEAKKLINLILKLREEEKLMNTFYNGLCDIVDNYKYEDNIIHCNLTQTATVTGRLSSSKPNLQQQTERSKLVFKSKFD